MMAMAGSKSVLATNVTSDRFPPHKMIMKRLLARWLAAGFASALFAATAQAQPKIGLIDLKKVFDGYYKTKVSDAQLKDRATAFDKARKDMIDEYQKTNDEYKKLIESSNDQAISADERDKKKKDAEKKLAEIRELESNVRSFDQQSRTTLAEQQKRMRENVLRDIRDSVAEKAKAAGYTLVVDVAAESINQIPVVLFNNGENDISDSVLTQLNASAPPDALKPKEEKKDDKKEDKKK
jgi:Skp family chaperone for outer membrane proteins